MNAITHFSPIRWSLLSDWFYVVSWKCAELAGTFRCSDVPSVVALFHDLDDVSCVDVQLVNVSRRVLEHNTKSTQHRTTTHPSTSPRHHSWDSAALYLRVNWMVGWDIFLSNDISRTATVPQQLQYLLDLKLKLRIHIEYRGRLVPIGLLIFALGGSWAEDPGDEETLLAN